MSDLDARILRMLRASPLSSTQIVERTGKGQSTVLAHLVALREQGAVTQTGKSSHSTWALAEPLDAREGRG